MPNRLPNTLTISLLLGFFVACKPVQTATKNQPSAVRAISAENIRLSIAQEGFAVGFPDTLKAAGKPFWFEASAIAFDGKSLLVAHDKPMPDGQSSVGSWPGLADLSLRPPTYFKEDVFKRGIKYEELALSPDRKWTFITTAFDRVKEGSSEWDGYNMLLAWPTGKPADAQVIGNNGGGTSVDLRNKIALALALNDQTYYGLVRYFKIEGLTVTDDRLIVGIRERGNSFQDFKYVVHLLAIPYRVVGQGNAQHIELTGGASALASINMAAQVADVLPPNLALSSIEYDAARDIFWILTTFETTDTVGAYLWTATEANLRAGKMNLVRTPANEPLRLTHKAEDMTFLNPTTLLLINDDDKLPTRINGVVRKPNQAAYTVLSVQ